MGCGSSTQAPGQLVPAAPEKASAPDAAGNQGDDKGNTPDAVEIPVGPASKPAKKKKKKDIDVESLNWLQKLEDDVVTELNVSRWTGKRAGDCPLDISALSLNLAKAEEIEVLYLGKNSLSDDQVKLLATAVAKNRSLVRLSLDFNSITPDGVVHLCDALRSAPSLTYIDLANNKIGDKGAIIMAEHLKRPNCAIKTLNMNSNGITAEGAKVLAEALKVNVSLESISLSLNKMNEGCDHFPGVFEKNTKLQGFMMLQTGGSLNSMIQVKRGLRRNMNMKELREHKVGFLIGCKPTIGGKPNTSELYSVFVNGGEGYDRAVLGNIWSYLHN